MYMDAYATQEELNQEAEDRKEEPVETNDIEGWPKGPKIGAEGAILIEANTGTILYAKNPNEKLFPASTTKIMTCLVAVENASLDDIVHVNQSAIDANASDGSNMGLYAGEELTLEEVLYGILINSANEGCNAVAEHIAGSLDGYVDMMNAKADSLGLTNTHFVSTNGLHDENHYTSAYDLSRIGVEFFKHDILCKMSSTSRYVIDETSSHREHYLNSHNKLLPGADYEYKYLVGSKTGFTSHSRQTLVSCAEKDGMKLICVIMKEESPYKFEDTVNLFNYGFDNFTNYNVYSNDKRYQIGNYDYFQYEDGYFGNTMPLVEMDKNDCITLPNTIEISDVDSSIVYGDTSSDNFASVEYTYQGQHLGSVSLSYSDSINDKSNFYEDHKGPTIINIKTVIKRIILITLGVIAFLIIFEFARKIFMDTRKRMKIKKNRKNSSSTRDGFSRRRKATSRPRSRSSFKPSSTNRHAITITDVNHKRRPPKKH